MVGADAHSAAELFAQQDKRGEGLFDAGELCGVFFIGVFDDGEFFLIGVIAGVDADAFHPLRGFEGSVGFEVDVGYDWDVAQAVFVEGTADVFEVGGVFTSGSGNANDLATSFG